MGRGCAPPSTSIDAEGLQRFFAEMIDGVRKSTVDAPRPHFVSAPSDCDFSTFHTLTVDDVIATIQTNSSPTTHFQRVF